MSSTEWRATEAVPTAEDILNAASHAAEAMAKIGVRDAAEEFRQNPSISVYALHDLTESLINGVVYTVLDAIVGNDDLRGHLAATISSSAIEMEREAGECESDLPPLSLAAKHFLHTEMVEKWSEIPQADPTADRPRFRCRLCEGEAETEAGVVSMHHDCCPLKWWGVNP